MVSFPPFLSALNILSQLMLFFFPRKQLSFLFSPILIPSKSRTWDFFSGENHQKKKNFGWNLFLRLDFIYPSHLGLILSVGLLVLDAAEAEAEAEAGD